MGVTRFSVLHYPINLNTWKKLPPDIQKILVEVGNEITMMYGIYMLGIEDSIMKEEQAERTDKKEKQLSKEVERRS